MERKELSKTLFTKAFETQRLASTVVRSKLSERLPMGRRSGSRCIEFIIRPNFLTSNLRFVTTDLYKIEYR
ncbi:hypothetical protein [Leptospira noguchii]|uniref:hypothetical protein n=1 Tax=Leptospira noguchii TaxID=28182 RepID=UPI001FB65DFA|nr:hypothetical protein [Leptospira noguchii]UOG42003.1 hypothetical protein MAL05_02535 [Leptospira noguchii]